MSNIMTALKAEIVRLARKEVKAAIAPLRKPANATRLTLADLKRRVAARSDESQGFLRTVHSSIELFQNNADLVPGTKQFDRELADEFIKLAKPYEVRNGDNKLIGFQIPVQPLIDSVRQRLAATRTAPPPAPPAPPAPEETHQPQAGIPAKAGNSGEGAEDFSALFSTLGLGGLRF